MYNTMGNHWVIPELGLLDIPEQLERRKHGWGISTGQGSWWLWNDADHGSNYMESLREAAAFAITIGSLEVDQARAYIELYRKDRLTPTGVLGVFYRSGLKQGYHIILDGQVVEFPYMDGRGFGKAATAVPSIMSAKTNAFVKKIGLSNVFRWP